MFHEELGPFDVPTFAGLHVNKEQGKNIKIPATIDTVCWPNGKKSIKTQKSFSSSNLP